MVRASVIIPSHNRAYILKHCLAYLSNQTTKDYEIIVVDDASHDETPDQITDYRLQITDLKYIRLKEQVGPYVARNIGIKKAGGEIIIFIDSDVLVHPRFVYDHIQIYQSNKRVFVQGMVRRIHNPEHANFKFYYPNVFCIGTFITQNASVPKKTLLEVGGFQKFGGIIGYKDVDLGLRLRKAGLREVHAFLKCKAYHVNAKPTSENLQEFFNKHRERGKSAYFFIKRHGKMGEKFAHTRKALFISRFFQTDKWAHKGLEFLRATQDSPILPLFPITRAIMKYHYRAKGIKEARSEG